MQKAAPVNHPSLNRPKLPSNGETWNEERPAKQKKKTIPPPQPKICSLNHLNHLNINDNSSLNHHQPPITMSLQTAGDIPILISSENSGSERRITPSWTIGQLKAKLEPVTGIPPLSQKLLLKRAGQPSLAIEANDEENTQLAAFPLAPYSEILVSWCVCSLGAVHLAGYGGGGFVSRNNVIHGDECRCRFGSSPQGLRHQVMNHSVHSFGGARLGRDSGSRRRLETEYNEASHFLYDLPQDVGPDKIRQEVQSRPMPG